MSEGSDPHSDELQQALENLRREIRSRFPAPRSDEPRSRSEWDGLLSRLRRRLSTLGMAERSGEVDEFGMDPVVVRRTQPLLEFLFEHYWRVDLAGLENLPQRGPCLLVCNRSGLLPYDGLMVSHAIATRHPSRERPRFFVADWLITLPFVQPYLARLGGVRACRENAERLLDSGRFAVVFPEGVKGAAKVFRERYRLKRFGRGGVVRIALERRTPLVPVGIVGGEEAHPILFKLGAPARAVGLPFLPVTPTFPLLGPLGLLPLPTKWVVRIGEPVPIEHLEPDAASDELLISRLTEDLRDRVQALVDQGLGDRDSVWA
ncbi:MAG: lysophospholipid acyltransferase family protein [Myxococcota bacterium]